MLLYHMSQTLKCGDTMTPDFQRLNDLSEPFVQALDHGDGCFYAMLLNGKYLYAVLCKSGLREWSNYAKWATEGLLEHIRRTEFPASYGRLNSFFFYDNLDDCKRLYRETWGDETEEERAKVHLFEVELDDEMPQRRDMTLYDKAYDAIEKQDMEAARSYARQYFAGEQSDKPVWELLSSKKAVVYRDITEML